MQKENNNVAEIKENDKFLMTTFESGCFCVELKKEDYTMDELIAFING